jgi:hypothetical protein
MPNLFSTSSLAILSSLLIGLGGSLDGAPMSASQPIGFYQLELGVGYQTVGVSVVNPALFGSWIASSGDSTITSSDATVDIGSLLDEAKSYYVEAVEGPEGTADTLVGQRFEIDVEATVAGGTPNGVVVLEMDAETTTWDSDSATAPDLSGYRFEIRAHVTLAQVFDPSLLYGSTNFAAADQIQVFNGSGFSIYYVLGDNSSFAQWTKQAGGDFASQDDLPIPPGEGLIFKRSSLSPGPVTLRVRGMARVTPFVQPMREGYNFVSEAFPASNSFEGKQAYPGSFGHLDRVQSYNGSGFSTYVLYTDEASTHLWVIGNDSSFSSQNLTKVFDYRGAVFVDLNNPAADYRIDPPYAP